MPATATKEQLRLTESRRKKESGRKAAIVAEAWNIKKGYKGNVLLVSVCQLRGSHYLRILHPKVAKACAIGTIIHLIVSRLWTILHINTQVQPGAPAHVKNQYGRVRCLTSFPVPATKEGRLPERLRSNVHHQTNRYRGAAHNAGTGAPAIFLTIKTEAT